MKEAYYFSHDSNARGDLKCSALIRDFGYEGYGLFWALIEILAEQDGYRLKKFGKLYEGLAYQLKVDAERFRSIIEALLRDYELLVQDENYIWSESLLRRKEFQEQRRQERSESGKRGGLQSGLSRREKKKREAELKLSEAELREIEAKRSKEIKEIKEIKAATIEPIVTPEEPSEPQGPVADAVADSDNLLKSLDNLACEVLGRICTSPLDTEAMKQMLAATGGDLDLISRKVREMKENFEPKFKGDRIRTFTYFLSGVLEAATLQKARAAPISIDKYAKDQQRAREPDTDQVLAAYYRKAAET
jgi:hypothetical protein